MADLLNLDVEIVFYDTTSLHFEDDQHPRCAGRPLRSPRQSRRRTQYLPGAQEARPHREMAASTRRRSWSGSP